MSLSRIRMDFYSMFFNTGPLILHNNPQRVDDVVKKGFLRKKKRGSMKNMTERYFVLRKETAPNLPARLEYYENEKAFKEFQHPKKQYLLKSCFVISKRDDPKFNYVIVIYIKKDFVCLVAKTEAELTEWLDVLIYHHKLAQREQPITGQNNSFGYRHVWPVEILDKGLATSNNLIGACFLSLTNDSISISRLEHEAATIEIRLTAIRGSKNLSEFFCLHIGRLAVTGCGELYMKTEDPCIAQSMASAVNIAMANFPTRNRTHSFTETSSSLQTPRGRCNTLPIRARTVSECANPNNQSKTQAIWQKRHISNSADGHSHVFQSKAIPAESIDEIDGMRCQTDSKDNLPEEGMLSPLGHSYAPINENAYLGMNPEPRRNTPRPVYKEEVDEYVTMGNNSLNNESQLYHSIPDGNLLSPTSANVNPFLQMKTVQSTSPTSTSVTHSRTPSIVEDTSNYTPMDACRTRTASLPIPVSSATDTQYTREDIMFEMSPERGNNLLTTGTPSSDQQLNEIGDLEGSEEEHSLPTGRTMRTSSVGDQYKNRYDRLDVNNGDSPRVRAFSVGSRVCSRFLGSNRLTASGGTSSASINPVVSPPAEFAPLQDLKARVKNKSTSAPILGTSPVSHSWSGPTGTFFRTSIPTRSNDGQTQSDYMAFSASDRDSKFTRVRSFFSRSKSGAKREQKKSEGEISRQGIAIPNSTDPNYCSMEINHSPRSHTSEGSEHLITTEPLPNGYLPMKPGSSGSSMEYGNGELNSSVSSASSRDDYVIMGISSSPQASTNRTRKISTVHNPLEGLLFEDYVEINNEPNYQLPSPNDKSKDKQKKSSKRKKSLKDKKKNGSEVEQSPESGSKVRNVFMPFMFTRKNTQNNQTKASAVSPQSSPIPKSNRCSSSPSSTLTRSRSRESKDLHDINPGNPNVGSSLPEDSESAISNVNVGMRSPISDFEPHKISRILYRNPSTNEYTTNCDGIIRTRPAHHNESLSLNISNQYTESSYCTITPNEPNNQDINMLSKCSSPLFSNNVNNLYMNIVPGQNIPTSPLRRASASWLPSPNQTTHKRLSINEVDSQYRTASLGRPTSSISSSTSPVHLNLNTPTEQRDYMNINPNISSVNNLNKKDLSEGHDINLDSSIPPPTLNRSISKITDEEEPNNYMLMEINKDRSPLKVLTLKKPEVPNNLLTFKAANDIKLDKLVLNESIAPVSERSRSHSGPGGNSQLSSDKYGCSIDKLGSKEGKASSACSSPVSYSPPTSPTLGSVSSMSSLSEGGLSSASSTCTVIDVARLSGQPQASSLTQHKLTRLPSTQKDNSNEGAIDSVISNDEAILNYASLDLTPGSSPKPGASPRSDRKSNPETTPSSDSLLEEQTNYTQIDFVKSEGLQTTSIERNTERQ